MTGKERLLRTLRHEDTGLAPWIPFAGVHAGKLTGVPADQLYQDSDLLLSALLEVHKLYKPCGQPVVFDLQLEAECLGCELAWSKNGPPSVSSHPLADELYVPCRCTIPSRDDGRLPVVLRAMEGLKAAVGEDTALLGLVCGPFTLASHLRGSDIFMDMFDEEELVKEFLEYCADVALSLADYFLEAGMDIIAVVDPLISQISADHFQEFMHTPFARIFRTLRDWGVPNAFFVCGDATRNIEPMCKTGPDAIFVDENVDLAAAKRITDRFDIAIGGNIPLTSVMLHGTQQDNMKYVIDLLDGIGSTKNLVVAPGCDMPYDIPVENTIAVAQAALRPEEAREIVKNYVAVEDAVPVQLPDYEHLERPLLEVFTLDSTSCAACQYMMEAANGVGTAFSGRIDVVEYKFTQKENISRCKAMGVKNLPSIYINGQLAFSSLIPSRETLEAAVRSALDGLAG